MKNQLIVLVVVLSVISCKNDKEKKYNIENMNDKIMHSDGSFAFDEAFLKKWDPELVVLSSGSSKVIVSSKYQGKVFTSKVSGKNGKSMGWINYEAFEKEDDHMNAYGGENRFWLGPEGNAFSLFFKSNEKFDFENWITPPPIDKEPWVMLNKSSSSVEMEIKMNLENYAGHNFKIKALRKVTMLSKNEIEADLDFNAENLSIVAYSTENIITNIGDDSWTAETGAPCIWILDMFPPSENTTIFIPYKNDVEGEIATTDYFGEISQDRIEYRNGMLFFKADGKSRGKLGLSPQRATNMAGSYDAINGILTLTEFDIDPKAIYLNQEWGLDSDPFKGDVLNAYNDGPLENGTQMGPFYELESVSPAAFLKPLESLTHNHTVFHFTGEPKELNEVVKSLFNVNLEEISKTLANEKI